jgi:F420-0:gamma-glutamyl ligase-like protein
MLYTVENAYELRYSREIVRIRIQCIRMHKNRKAVQKVYELKCKADSIGIEMLDRK